MAHPLRFENWQSGSAVRSAGQAGPVGGRPLPHLVAANHRGEGDRVKRAIALGAGLWKDERAEISLEYGLLVAMVALAMVVVFGMFGGELSEFFGRVTGRVQACTDIPGQSC